MNIDILLLFFEYSHFADENLDKYEVVGVERIFRMGMGRVFTSFFYA